MPTSSPTRRVASAWGRFRPRRARPDVRRGLSATTITRPTTQWQDEARAFGQRPLAGTDYVYVWVDGIHLKVRLELLVVTLHLEPSVPVSTVTDRMGR